METSSPYASPPSVENSMPARRQGQKNGHHSPASSRHTANAPSTPPTQVRMQPPASAPPRSRAHLLLTSPEATRRSKESLETFRVARTLKEGLLRLKARADPHATPSISMTALRRPMRTFSATTAGAVAAGNNNNPHAAGAMARRPLLRHHSEIPWHMRSLDRQHSRAPSATSPSTAAGPALMPVFRSPKSHPVPLHPAHSCPQQHQLLGGTNSDGLLLSPVSSNTRSQPHNTRRDNIRPTPKFSLDQATEDRACSTANQRLRTAATANSMELQKRPRSPGDESSQHSEVAEAAETMILFMKSEASSQNDLSTPSFSPPQLNCHSPSVSPLINSAFEAASSFAHPGSINGANSSVDEPRGNTPHKRPRSETQIP